MSESYELIMDSTNKIFKHYCTKELLDRAENGHWPQELWDVLAEAGIISIGFSEQAGGVGGDYIDAYNILKLAGKYGVPVPLAETLIGKWLFAEVGGQVGDIPLTLALQNDSNFSFVDEGDGYTLGGSASAVPWARYMEQILICGDLNGKQVAALVPLAHAEIREENNIAAEPRDSVIFSQVKIDGLTVYQVDSVLISEKSLYYLALAKAAMMAGAAERVMELSLFYANERQQFGRSLHRFQGIQHHIASLAGETVACITAVNTAVQALQDGQYKTEIPLAKMKVSAASGKIAMAAHQLHGAIGMTYEHSLHHLTRRLWSWRDESGNESYWGSVLAKSLIEKNSPTLWEVLTDEQNLLIVD
ncbi:acyl-CoA dehydrogenase family protein [Cytobacillus purgationiresistens]|uniref:Acyl-CoA dehydrogenase n=1 Tax=Cytobacillus purgationiresistens TaxID=863449 RepID=A0ABU0AFV6_9BACI|nr:acyl-CoA dehydrogenase family protein [Cytobacillus purgationiresistens]MDQ0269749.1 acyl-CoA dehydrogenase [Cytobacillus purgationiresistens]